MAATFWKAVLLCQLGIAAMVAYLLSVTTSLAFGPVAAVSLGVFWCAPAALLACALALSHRSAQPEHSSLSDYLHLLQSILSETLWFTPTALTMSFGAGGHNLSQPPAVGSQPQPVLLIHGILCNSRIWNPLIRHLQRAGIGPVRTLDLEPALQDIELHAIAIARALRDLQAQTRGARVMVIAHSMGGLVARAAVREIGPAVVSQLITVGSPHHGTVLARLSRSAPARQMRPESAWLAELNAVQEGHLPVPTTSIYSLEDWLIRPPRSALLRGASPQELRGVGHLGLLRTRRSLTYILAALTPRMSA